MKPEKDAARSVDQLDADRLQKLLEAFDRVQVLVVGDVVLDEYLWGRAERISPEAPVPVVQVDAESTVLGGAGNVARNVIALGGRCALVSVVGDDADAAAVRGALANLGIAGDGIVCEAGRPTTRKTRVVAGGQQVVRFDRETRAPVAKASVAAMLDATRAWGQRLDAAILVDYAKGVLCDGLVAPLLASLGERGVPVAVDPKEDVARYRGASLLKPNWAEACRMASRGAVPVESGSEMPEAALFEALARNFGESRLVVTRGRAGMTILEPGEAAVVVPTAVREVFDVQGAGDTAMATLVLAASAGASLLEAAVLANAAAGVVIGKMGTATATRGEVGIELPRAIASARGEK
ncbi:MAG: PfkB family carbohydrate kinase [Myxococcota bacterium]